MTRRLLKTDRAWKYARRKIKGPIEQDSFEQHRVEDEQRKLVSAYTAGWNSALKHIRRPRAEAPYEDHT